MKGMILAACTFVFSLGISAFAATVNPTSNVLGDTAATAGTLVLRGASGQITYAAGDINTAAIAANVVDTSKVNFKSIGSVTSDAIVCVMGGNLQQFGVCTGNVSGNKCTCG